MDKQISRYRSDGRCMKRLVESFVNAVFVYDDKVVFTFNYKDGSKTATMDEINAELGSDLDGTSPPQQGYTHAFDRCAYFFCFVPPTPLKAALFLLRLSPYRVKISFHKNYFYKYDVIPYSFTRYICIA